MGVQVTSGERTCTIVSRVDEAVLLLHNGFSLIPCAIDLPPSDLICALPTTAVLVFAQSGSGH